MSAAQKLTRFDQALAVAIESLTDLACWDEGPEVTGKFDEPSSARKSREALEKIQTILAGGK